MDEFGKTTSSLLQCNLESKFSHIIYSLPTFLQTSLWIPFLSVILHLSSVFSLPKVSSQQWMIQCRQQFQSWFLHVQVQSQDSNCEFQRLSACITYRMGAVTWKLKYRHISLIISLNIVNVGLTEYYQLLSMYKIIVPS